MIENLRRGQVRSFIAQMSVFTGLSPAVILSVIEQPTGQGLAVIAHAFEINKPDFVSIFLLTNKIRHNTPIVSMEEISKAVDIYNRITPEMARSIMDGSITAPDGKND